MPKNTHSVGMSPVSQLADPSFTIEEVPTPRGWRASGDIYVGDEVFGSDGGPTIVTDVLERGKSPTFRVSFSDGSSSVVHGDHPWLVLQRRGKSQNWAELTMTTDELLRADLRAPTHASGRSRGWRFTVPMPRALQYSGQALLVEPYTLGALIANGGLTAHSAVLTTPDHDVVARIRHHYAVPAWQPSAPGEVCARGTVQGVIGPIRRLGLDVRSGEKFIPPIYLRGDVEQRIALLQGLMDGDGADRGPSRASVQYFTSSRTLARDMTELVTSLGGTASDRWYTRAGQRAEGVLDLMLPTGIEPFHTSRKRRGMPRKSSQPRRAIVAVAPAGNRHLRSISVASVDCLYVVGRHHLVTMSNTSW